MRRLLPTLLLTCAALVTTATPGSADGGVAVPDIAAESATPADAGPSDPASATATTGAPRGSLIAVDPGTGTQYESDRVVVPMTFPVAGRVRYSDNWLACRSGCARMHMGQDLMGAKMTPLVAAFDGVVTSIRRESGTTNGGNYIAIAGDRGRSAGWAAIYVHVNNDTPGTDDGRGTDRWAFPSGLEVGSRVLEGQLIGWMGDSGNAEGTAPHLHFELRRGTGWGGVVYNAYPTLRAARQLSRPLPSGPHPDGTLVRHPTGLLFVLEGGAKRAISPATMAAQGRDERSAVPITSAESLGYPTLSAEGLPDGVVARDPRGTTWLVTGGGRAKAYMKALAALGRRTPRIFNVTDAELAPLPVKDMPDTPLYAGALVRPVGAPNVSYVDDRGRLRPLSHPAELWSHGLSFRDVADLPTEVLDRARTGDGLGLRDGTLVQTPSHFVAVVSGGAARQIRDTRQVRDYGYTGRLRFPVPDALLAGLDRRELTQR